MPSNKPTNPNSSNVIEGSACDVMGIVLDCDIQVTKVKLQSRCYVHFVTK